MQLNPAAKSESPYVGIGRPGKRNQAHKRLRTAGRPNVGGRSYLLRSAMRVAQEYQDLHQTGSCAAAKAL